MTDRIVIEEDGIPRFGDRCIDISCAVAEIGARHILSIRSPTSSTSNRQVRAALTWAAQHPEHVDSVFRRRADALREERLEFPGEVEPPDGEDDAGEYLRRARGTLANVQREWHPYADPSWWEE